MKRARSRSRSRKSKRIATARPFNIKRARRNIARSRMSMKSEVHPFSRWGIPSQYNSLTGQGGINFDSFSVYSNGNITTNASTAGQKELPLTLQFSFNQIDTPQEFINLYDQYKICGVKVSIKMINAPEANNGTQSTSVNSLTNFYPTLWYVRDYDDPGLLPLTSIRQYKAAKHVTLQPNREVSIYVKPRISRQIFQSNTGAGYEVVIPKFINLTNDSVPHYGLKMVVDFEGLDIPLNSAANQWRFRIQTKYYFMCKNVR